MTLNIVSRAFGLAKAVDRFKERVRLFYYQVILTGQACPRCGGKPAMVKDGLCRCKACGHEIDPTIVFQRCSDCGGIPLLHIRRYQCRSGGRDIVSRFLLDGLVFKPG